MSDTKSHTDSADNREIVREIVETKAESNEDRDARETPDAATGAMPHASTTNPSGWQRANTPPSVPWGDEYDTYLGGEAAVPAGNYGPPISSHLPDYHAITGELRELERRVRAHLTPAFPIETRRRLPLRSVWNRYRRFAMRRKSDFVDDFGRDPRSSARVEPFLEFLYNRYFRVGTTGLEHVPDNGSAMLVANHAGALPYDAAMIMHAVRKYHPAHRDARPLLEDYVFHFPYLGTLINRIGAVRACQQNATRLLESGQLITVFPEGIKGIGKLYKQRYQLQRFGRGGFIKLALRTGVPIVPIAVIGAEEAVPMVAKVTWLAKSMGVPFVPVTPTFPLFGPAGLLPVPSKWTMKFGEPIDLRAEYGPEAAKDRILVNRLAEEVRARIQSMVDGMVRERKSVLRG